MACGPGTSGIPVAVAGLTGGDSTSILHPMVLNTNSRAPAPPGLPQQPPVAGSNGLRRSEVFRRLQMGGIGIVGVLVLIALASLIQERAQMTDRGAVPQASLASGGTPSTAAPDPLAQAGVVPDIPATPTNSREPGKTDLRPSPPNAN